MYDTVCDTLELSIGTELDKMCEISIDDLKRRSKLSSSVIRSSLKVLKRQGVLEVLNRVSPQIGVSFVISRDRLHQRIRDEDNKRKAMFLDVLYRQFGDEAFRQVKYLATDYLRRKLQVDSKSLIQGLRILQDHDHILQYKMIGELPMVRTVEPRMENLPVKRKKLEEYRQSLLKKLEFMVGYIETNECRENIYEHISENKQPVIAATAIIVWLIQTIFLNPRIAATSRQ